MKIRCDTTISDNALGKSRITGAHFRLESSVFEDQIILQFMEDNHREIKLKVGEYEWVCKQPRGV